MACCTLEWRLAKNIHTSRHSAGTNVLETITGGVRTLINTEKINDISSLLESSLWIFEKYNLRVRLMSVRVLTYGFLVI